MVKTDVPVSQIFLTLKEGVKINDFPIYERGVGMFKKITKRYTLFNDKKADTLMKKYPEFYQMWKDVRYPIMRVDIVRFIILYHYGGFLCDLDVFPVEKNLNKVIKGNEDKFIIFTPVDSFNYEVLYSPPRNEIMLDFVRYIKEQIQEKSKMRIYDTWKGRFVLQTTGPKSYKRFLDKYHKNDPDIKIINILSIYDATTASRFMNEYKKYPFVSMATSEWLKLSGMKEMYGTKKEVRDEVVDDLYELLDNK